MQFCCTEMMEYGVKLAVGFMVWYLGLHLSTALRDNEACLQSQSGSVRLSGLNSSYIGYIQVCRTGHWISIAFEEEENEWSRKNSIVACRELGFQSTIGIVNRDGSSGELGASDPGSLSPHQYYSVQCTGLEARLVDCTWTIRTVKSRKKDAMVLCKEAAYDGEVMVVGVSGEDKEGIVALYNPLKTYRWSTVCDTEWDDTDAAVVCKQLGYSGGVSTSYSSEDESLSNYLPRKRYNYFECSGSELKLSECQHHGPYPYQCSSQGYAGVNCNKDSEDDSVLNLNITLLSFMIFISTLLIIILSLLLRCTLKRFRKKPTSHHRSADSASEEGREQQTRISSLRPHIVRTHLDLDMPYASLSTVAPPSYEDTLLADQIVQQDSAPEYTPNAERDTPTSSEDDVGSNSSANNPLLAETDTEITHNRTV